MAFVHFENIEMMRTNEAYKEWQRSDEDNKVAMAMKCADKKKSVQPNKKSEDPYLVSVYSDLHSSSGRWATKKGILVGRCI